MIDRIIFYEVKALLDPFIALKERVLTDGEIFNKVCNAMVSIGIDLVDGAESARLQIHNIMGMDIMKVYKKMGYSEPYNEFVYPAAVVYEAINNTSHNLDVYDTYVYEMDRINSVAELLYNVTPKSDFFLPLIFQIVDSGLQYDIMSCLANFAMELSKTSHYVTKDGIQWSIDYLAESVNVLIGNTSDLVQSFGVDLSALEKDESLSNNFISSSHGYVYILTNESMPNLVKIGMTTNMPDQRVKELSSATGVPTEFNLVYYREFGNCREAESNIHKILTDRGLRYNSRREFFTIDTTEAINLLLSLPDTVTTYLPENDSLKSEYVFTRKDYFDIDEFKKESDARLDIYNKIKETRAFQLYVQAMNYHLGDGVLKDDDEAIRLFKQSMDYGYLLARDYYAMLVAGDDVKKYIKIMTDAVKQGSVSAYIMIAIKLTDTIFYHDDLKNLDKEDKEQVLRCLQLYERDFYKAPDLDLVDFKVADYIALSLLMHYEYDRSFIKYILEDVESGHLTYRCSLIDIREYIVKRIRKDWDDFINKRKFRGYSQDDSDGLTSEGNTPSERKERIENKMRLKKEREENMMRIEKEGRKKQIEQSYSRPYVNILLGLLCCSVSIIPCILYFAGWWMSCAFILFTFFMLIINNYFYPNITTISIDGTRIGDYVSFGSWIANAFFLSLVSVFPILMMTELGGKLFVIYFNTSFLIYEGGIVVFATVLINIAILVFSTYTILDNFKRHDENNTYGEVVEKIKENAADVLKGFTISVLLVILVVGSLYYIVEP